MSDGQNDKLLNLKNRRLQKLKEVQAIKGISTPPEVLIEIEEIETEIKQLQGQSQQDEPVPSRAPMPPTGQTPSSGSPTETEKKRTSKWWIPIVVALIGLAGVVFATVWNNFPSPVEPPQEEMPAAEFEYLVRVQSDSGENLPDARVTIEVGGRAPLDAYTDSNGIAVIFIDASYSGKPGFLIIERDGFHPFRQNIELVMNALPDLIRLESVS